MGAKQLCAKQLCAKPLGTKQLGAKHLGTKQLGMKRYGCEMGGEGECKGVCAVVGHKMTWAECCWQNRWALDMKQCGLGDVGKMDGCWVQNNMGWVLLAKQMGIGCAKQHGLGCITECDSSSLKLKFLMCIT